MALLQLKDVSLSFGGRPLLDAISLEIEPGDRIGLVGRNGSGKSTLLKILSGEIVPDSGTVAPSGRLEVALLPQDVPEGVEGTIYDVVASGCQGHLDLLHAYNDLTARLGRKEDRDHLPELERIQQRIETSGVWEFHQRVKTVINRTGLDEHAPFASLSAGMKRRVFLAKALVSEPGLLLLDEPSNHLDIATILWLEDFLLKYDRALMFVTHDRAFLARLSTRIVEIDRGSLKSFPCPYATYLERRALLLDSEEKQQQDFDKKLAREEAWLRKGVRARRTRNEGRVRTLLHMREERRLRQEQQGVSRLGIAESQRSGRLVVEAGLVSFSWDKSKEIIRNFSTTILRGDRVGIIGPNGSGKTTLLRILLGQLQPVEGKIRLGTGIRIAYFDQLREQLDGNRTLRENIGNGNDTLVIGTSSRHVVGYLQDFLFSPERINSPVRTLSGGERNRLLLAKLFAVPSNVLVLDEPTNDLDAETLDLFEDRLLAYKGTILLVSHDREFLNNVVTSTIVFEGEGRLQEYVGGYDDWLSQRSPSPQTVPVRSRERGQKKEKPPREKERLSYKETRELEGLPQAIEAMEKEKRDLVKTINDPAFYASYDASRLRAVNERLEVVEKDLDEAYRRWDELQSMSDRFNAGREKLTSL